MRGCTDVIEIKCLYKRSLQANRKMTGRVMNDESQRNSEGEKFKQQVPNVVTVLYMCFLFLIHWSCAV